MVLSVLVAASVATTALASDGRLLRFPTTNGTDIVFSCGSTLTGKVPEGTFYGPKVCLINKYSASDGDLFPWSFKANGLGELIGTRTWGGIVGISRSLQYMDGTDIRVPFFTNYDAKTVSRCRVSPPPATGLGRIARITIVFYICLQNILTEYEFRRHYRRGGSIPDYRDLSSHRHQDGIPLGEEKLVGTRARRLRVRSRLPVRR